MSSRTHGTRTRRFFVVSLLAALLVAGVASFYASSHPDGLEFVAEKTGFIEHAEDSPTASSPFADYSTKGVENGRISGGIAGVAGSLIVLSLAGGLFWVLRRRGHPDDRDEADTDTDTGSDVTTTSGR